MYITVANLFRKLQSKCYQSRPSFTDDMMKTFGLTFYWDMLLSESLSVCLYVNQSVPPTAAAFYYVNKLYTHASWASLPIGCMLVLHPSIQLYYTLAVFFVNKMHEYKSVPMWQTKFLALNFMSANFHSHHAISVTLACKEDVHQIRQTWLQVKRMQYMWLVKCAQQFVTIYFHNLSKTSTVQVHNWISTAIWQLHLFLCLHEWWNPLGAAHPDRDNTWIVPNCAVKRVCCCCAR